MAKKTEDKKSASETSKTSHGPKVKKEVNFASTTNGPSKKKGK